MEKFNEYFLLINEVNRGRFVEYSNHSEAVEYSGCEYCLKDLRYIQRTAKITPKKIGQFVTLWKRNENGITVPFDIKDNFDISDCVKAYDGKRGFRVYPKWDIPTNKQAIETQKWQLDYFTEGLLL